MKRSIFIFCFILFSILLVSCDTPSDDVSTKWKVTFMVNEEVYHSEKVNNFEKVSKPVDPVIENFCFIGWYHGDVKFDFNCEIATDITLVAKFVKESDEPNDPVSYNVIFYVNNEVYYETIVLLDHSITKPTEPYLEGFAFIGWYLENDILYNFNDFVSNDIVLYAKFDKIEEELVYYNVKFIVNEEVYYETAVLENESISEPSKPYLNGYEFLGWYLDDNIKYDFDSLINQHTTLYAKFKIVVVDILYETYGYEEGLCVKLDSLDSIVVYYKKTKDSSWIKVDHELVRKIDDYTRIDIVGLTSANYDVKVEFVNGGVLEIKNVFVEQIDRSGYAFFNTSEGVGAYNLDGTLKTNAVVLYVNDQNKNTISYKGYTGLVAILQNASKFNHPLVIRIIGSITTNQWNYKSVAPRLANNINLQLDTFWVNELENIYEENLAGLALTYSDRYLQKKVTYLSTPTGYKFYQEGSSSKSTTTYSGSEFGSIKGKTVYDDDSYWNMLDIKGAKNVTLEGIGTDASFVQFGLNWKQCDSIEVKNITFTDYPEDACSFEGDSDDITKYGRYFIHNNKFTQGKNNWDVTGERDKPAGDGAIDIRTINGITVSYNEFNKCKKTGLVGGSDSVLTMNVTFHHNYYNEVGSRLPLGRQANMHIYNNYYYKCSTCQDIRANAFVLSEANYFESCNNPQKVTTSSDYSKTVIKSYMDYFTGCGTSKAKIVSSRTEKLSGACKPDGKTDYSNFDTNSTLFYYDSVNKISKVYRLTSAEDAKDDVLRLAGVLKK